MSRFAARHRAHHNRGLFINDREEEFSEVSQEFIGNSSPLASVVALINLAGLTSLALRGGREVKHR